MEKEIKGGKRGKNVNGYATAQLNNTLSKNAIVDRFIGMKISNLRRDARKKIRCKGGGGNQK